MKINGLFAYVLCSFLIASGFILVGAKGGRLHPDIEAKRNVLMREIRSSWRCLNNAGALGAIPAILLPASRHPGCYVGADFELSGRAAFEIDTDGKIKASPMTSIRQNVDLLASDSLLSGVAQAWAADAVIHQYAQVNKERADFIQRSVKYGDHESDISPGVRRTQILISALITAITAPELANTELLRWQADGAAAVLTVHDQGQALNWRCQTPADNQWRCETAQAELNLMGQPSKPQKLTVTLSNWGQINQQKMPRDWVISWGEEGWVEYRGTLEAVRREPPPAPNQAERPT